MDKNTLIWIGAGLLVLAAIYGWTQQRPVFPPSNTSPDTDLQVEMQKNLFFQALQTGRNATQYVYAYQEDINGYGLRSRLWQATNGQQASFESPIAAQDVYWSGNDTVYCIALKSYNASRVCADGANISRDSGVLDFERIVRSLFFNSSSIDQTLDFNRKLIAQGVIRFVEPPQQKEVDTHACTRLAYRYDHTQLTLAQLQYLDIGTSNLASYDGEWCVGNDGTVYEKIFRYKVGDRNYTSRFRLEKADWSYSGAIEAPPLTANGTSSAARDYMQMREMQNYLQANCYAMEKGSERDRCISGFAIGRRMSDMCADAGARVAICTTAIALDVKDGSLCGNIVNVTAQANCASDVAAAKRDGK